VVTAAQLRTGPFKTVENGRCSRTMEGKFWGAWRVARAAEIRPGGSLTLVTGFLSIRPRPNSAIVGAGERRARIAGTKPCAGTRAGPRQRGVAGIIDTPIRAAMPEEARRDMLARPPRAAGRPCRRGGRHRPPDPGVS